MKPHEFINADRFRLFIRRLGDWASISVFEYPDLGVNLFTEGHIIIPTDLAEHSRGVFRERETSVHSFWSSPESGLVPMVDAIVGDLYDCGPEEGPREEWFRSPRRKLTAGASSHFVDELFFRLFPPDATWRAFEDPELHTLMPFIVKAPDGQRIGLVMGSRLKMSEVRIWKGPEPTDAKLYLLAEGEDRIL